MNRVPLLLLAAACCSTTAAAAPRVDPKNALTAWILTKDGTHVEGAVANFALPVAVDGKRRSLWLKDVLSLHTGDPAGSQESERISAGLAAIAGADRKAREAAVAELTDIGLPALTPVLAAYKDRDARQPDPLFRLFARLVPGHADRPDRNLDLVRLRGGEALRGDLLPVDLTLTDGAGKPHAVPASSIRRLAIRQREIEREFDVQALHHCTQIEFLDTGISLTPPSRLTASAHGYARLDFNQDGWSSDPDGLKVPGPRYKTNLVDGFPFGALVGRIGPAGARWMAGRHAEKSGLEPGRLYFAINDNPHWQNNIGSYRVRLRVTEAYDLGDAQ